MAFTYARDPSLLLHSENPFHFAPPLNYENHLNDGIQPVRYEDKKLKIALGGYGKINSIVQVIDINWLNGLVVGYNNTEEAMNNVPAFSLEYFRIPCQPAQLSEYIMETIAFLKRGHSLTHPHCTCMHEINENRCKTLGISYVYSEFNKRRHEIPCTLSRHPREFSSKEVSDELAISDLILFKIRDISLLSVLDKHCKIRVDGMQLFFSCMDFVFSPLNNREDLLVVLASQPLTFTVAVNLYPTLLLDIFDLERLKRLLILGYNNDTNIRTITLFYLNPKWDMRHIDSDIIDLWHSTNVKISRQVPEYFYQNEISNVKKPKGKTKKKKRALYSMKK